MPECMNVGVIYETRRSIVREIPARVATEQHTEDCLCRTFEWLWQKFLYESRWPDYCQKCNGWGVLEYTENQSPYGSGEYWPMPMSEPCICLTGDEMVCPRCGTPIYDLISTDQRLLNGDDDPDAAVDRWFDEMYPCPVCGWNWGKVPAPEEIEMEMLMSKLGIETNHDRDALDSPYECFCWETCECT